MTDYNTDTMPSYRSHKVVKAVKIEGVSENLAALIVDGGKTVTVGDPWLTRHKPEAGGYYVRYEDGYSSYSPAKAFEEGYIRVGDNSTPSIAVLKRVQGELIAAMQKSQSSRDAGQVPRNNVYELNLEPRAPGEPSETDCIAIAVDLLIATLRKPA